jgi:hypothetical protein
MKVTPGYANRLPNRIRLDLKGSTVRREGDTIGSLEAAVCERVRKGHRRTENLQQLVVHTLTHCTLKVSVCVSPLHKTSSSIPSYCDASTSFDLEGSFARSFAI